MFHAEADFQKALDASPEESTIRLVFADWLEENGDPRAEGYRALGVNGWRAHHWDGNYWLSRKDNDGKITDCQPFELIDSDWFLATAHWSKADSLSAATRREIEDRFALSFAKLPAARRAELLSPASAPAPAPA